MIAWPVIVRFYNDDELMFVSDANEWDMDAQRFLHSHDENDTVIDCAGRVYVLSADDSGKYVRLTDSGEDMPLDEFTGLIKRHVSALGECCAAKLGIDTFDKGMRIVAQTGNPPAP